MLIFRVFGGGNVLFKAWLDSYTPFNILNCLPVLQFICWESSTAGEQQEDQN
jgi:hypothetical protein